MKPGTIYALASGIGKAGVAVIRISGDASESIFSILCSKSPAPRVATRFSLVDPQSQNLLDQALVLWFPAPASFTGENVVELHVHGGRAVVDGVMGALSRMDGFRVAEPGEFTRRAFENSKMDLTAAEGLADLVDAETTAQRDQALRQMQGALGDMYEDWRHRLLQASAYLETTIDFAEEDIPAGLEADVRELVQTLKYSISDHLDTGHRGERLRDGVRVVLLGQPNGVIKRTQGPKFHRLHRVNTALYPLQLGHFETYQCAVFSLYHQLVGSGGVQYSYEHLQARRSMSFSRFQFRLLSRPNHLLSDQIHRRSAF